MQMRKKDYIENAIIKRKKSIDFYILRFAGFVILLFSEYKTMNPKWCN